MAYKFFKSKSLIICLLFNISLGTLFFLKDNFYLIYVIPTGRQRIILESLQLKSDRFNIEGQACIIPNLDVNASEIMDQLRPVSELVCNEFDWVEVNGSTVKIKERAKEIYRNIQCSFTDILRIDDTKQQEGMTTVSHTEYNLEESDTVKVFCTSETELTWSKVVTGIRSSQEIRDRVSWAKVPDNALKLNFLMFGFDSMSHNMWKRKLSRTYKYATEDLKGIALNGYNILGDGTPEALIPLLTGKTELELPNTQKKTKYKTHYVNIYPFIWNDFYNYGYVTAWAEDMVEIGTFNYRLRGFKEAPVDHYLRTFYVEASKNFFKKRRFCYGQLQRHQIMIDFVKNVYEVYKDRPKFVFAFHGEYSHDDTDAVAYADNDVYEWLKEFNRKGFLNDTLLVLMSDHGSRFASFRLTLQGKQEERLPGFIFVFPPWFSKKYPAAYENFKKNINRLSTPFDIHETIKEVLNFKGAGMGSTEYRGISLFKEIPLSRTCEDANIEPHWCTCLEWHRVPVTDKIVRRASAFLLRTINNYTAPYRTLCRKLVFNTILWSAKLTPNESLLNFKGTNVIGVSREKKTASKINTEYYQVKVSFNPGNMIFEATISYYPDHTKFLVSRSEISRINKYRNMTHCIEDRDILHHLRKFCNCQEDFRNNSRATQ